MSYLNRNPKMYQYKTSLLFFILLFAQTVKLSAQNLLLCPGFEESGTYDEAPKTVAMEDTFMQLQGSKMGPYLLFWKKPLLPEVNSDPVNNSKYNYSPDYFRADFRREYERFNYLTDENTAEGKGCIFLLLGMEFLMGQFTEPMQKDSVYDITFKIKQSCYTAYSEPSLGILFTGNITHRITLDDYDKNCLHTISLRKRGIGRKDWQTIQTTYKATGGEKYMILGFQKSKRRLDVFGGFKYTKMGFFKWTGYYMFDDFCIKSVTSANCKNQTKEYLDKILYGIEPLEKQTISDPETIFSSTLHLTFKTNDYLLNEESEHILDSIYNKILEVPELTSYTIEIHGHTDDVGDFEDNIVLSRERAESVSDYLISLGIPITPQLFAHGESEPIKPETTEQVRRLNRRVEIIIKSKE